MKLHASFPPTRATLLLSLLLAPALVLAQAPAPASAETVELEKFTVTGTNIRGVDTEKTLPVTVITAEDITTSGIGTLSELVENLPFSTNVTINETSGMPNDARGDVSSINLRNLGAGRTLVLLNGRRLSAYGVTPGTPPVQFVNVNAIPLGAIQQVEVLRDGASAIYGSDAIGGVVNTILKKTYDRSETSARYSFAADGGSPRETSVTVAGGRVSDSGRTSLTLVYSFYHRDLLMATERDYSASADKRPLVGAPFNTSSSFNGLNSSSPYGRFTTVTDAGAGVAVAGISGANGQFYYDPVTGARASGAGPTGFYNSQAGTQLLPEITRHNLFGSLEHRVNAALSFFGELSYYDAHSFGQIDTSPISLTTDGIFVPKTNYYNPAGTRFQGPGTANPSGTPRNVAIRNYRPTEIGPRSYDTDSDSVRLLAGLRGSPSGTTWTWDAAAMYMRGETYQVNHGYISASRFLQQLALSTPDAYNPFGPPGSNPESVWRNFVIDIWDRGIGTLTSFDAKASGEFVRLPGGALSVAVGGEYRRETMQQRNDPFGLADDVIAQSEQLDVDASRDVYAGFAEVLVPLIGPDNHVALARSLELRVAGRYEHYKGFSAAKPGVGLSWRPADWLLLRASYNEGFRAPTIVELYTPAVGRRNDNITDTARAGQPDAAPSISKRIVTGGNPNLRPEESESYNYGVVFDVPLLKGLSFGADAYRIRQFNQIDNSDAQDELDLDNELWDSGQGGNPRVIREPRTATDIANNLPGVLIEVLSTYQNLSLREVEGTDFFVNYRTPRWSFGRFNLTGTVSYVDRLRSIDEKGNAVELVANNGNPRLKASAGVSWSRGPWSASVHQRYTDRYNGPTSLTTAGTPFIIGSYAVTNASVGYAFRRGALDGLRLRVGANNVFDEPPPLYPANSSGYHPSYADPRGRTLYVDVTYRF
ncbi:MAG: TonB-dependent receptor [Opitutaceae bacterium]|nr:TonB-dependent receptor [Opitutaceae bacterium]